MVGCRSRTVRTLSISTTVVAVVVAVCVDKTVECGYRACRSEIHTETHVGIDMHTVILALSAFILILLIVILLILVEHGVGRRQLHLIKVGWRQIHEFGSQQRIVHILNRLFERGRTRRMIRRQTRLKRHLYQRIAQERLLLAVHNLMVLSSGNSIVNRVGQVLIVVTHVLRIWRCFRRLISGQRQVGQRTQHAFAASAMRLSVAAVACGFDLVSVVRSTRGNINIAGNLWLWLLRLLLCNQRKLGQILKLWRRNRHRCGLRATVAITICGRRRRHRRRCRIIAIVAVAVHIRSRGGSRMAVAVSISTSASVAAAATAAVNEFECAQRLNPFLTVHQ
mmetsp:Transcript_35616/g.58391  ORF Transcript_35616/g.58391 Transcript_35616/m.58391 type:complete len:337 (+) Transcript_35616:700-1710(+)